MADGPAATGFEDLYLLNNSVPEVDLAQVNTGIVFLGRELKMPLIINAITGRIREADELNRDLSQLARRKGLGMAVGSQVVAMHEKMPPESFRVVRRENPGGLVLANVSARSRFPVALKAVEMLEADGLQVHLNVPQELAMPEGDREFCGVLDNITELVKRSPVPVIAKEVGFGLSREAAERLIEAGVEYLDIGGRGGTNFIAIENRRGGLFGTELTEWGISTAVSLLEVLSLSASVKVVASGGIRGALDAAKALALGAEMVGMAAPLLRMWQNGGLQVLEDWTEAFGYRLKAVMLMTGVSNMAELRNLPVLITGQTAEWIRARGIDPERWSRKGVQSYAQFTNSQRNSGDHESGKRGMHR